MHIEKLPSGSYRITQTENGKRYRITVDHKPTKTEATRLLADVIEKTPVTEASLTLNDACNQYIKSRDKVLSPATIRGYLKITRNIPGKFANMRLKQITNETLQAIVNDYTPGHSSKTVKNMSCFIVSVLSAHNITLKSPTLPQTEKKSPYIPTKEDITRIFEYLSGTKYEVPITLAALGLRRSEICALTLDDLNGNVLTINKAMVQDSEGKWVIKSTKTTASTRTVTIPDALADLIRKQGCVYEGFPAMIYKHLKMAQRDLEIQPFTLHKMRHFFASYMHDIGYTDKQIQEAGGWRDGSRIMKMVYQHAMEMDEAKKGMADSIGGLMNKPKKKANGKPTKKPTKK